MVVRLNCLGTVQAAIDSTPLKKFRGEKVQALLIYLAIETEQTHTRQSLATLLWPDYEEVVARDNLRVAFYRLKTIFRQHDTGLAKQLFRANRRSIQADISQAAWLVDVAQFRAHIAAVSNHPHADLATCSSCELHLKEAAALYKGDFLTNFPVGLTAPFDEWVQMTRVTLRQQMVSILEKLIKIANSRADYAGTITYARQLIAIEPWQESAHRHLMLALAKSGQRLAALAQFDTCCQILEVELDVSPSDETFSLFQQIKVGEKVEKPLKVDDLPPQTAVKSNLPQQLTQFFGRTTAVAQLEALLLADGKRLVTIVGVGGMGKTRLALQVGEKLKKRFAAGVWFVPLDGVQPRPSMPLPQQLATAVLAAFNLRLAEKQSPLAQLITYLQTEERLLILDNFEHLLTDCAKFILPLLQRCPQLTILTTSREPLQFQAESLYWLQGMSLAAHLGGKDEQPIPMHIRPTAALRLFAARAVAVAPHFKLTAANATQVSQICQFVGGCPLAIELAAGLLGRWTLDEVTQSLTQSLDALVTRQRDIVQRHRSMRLILEQSWELLHAAEQQLVAQLALFQGGCTVEAMLAITQARSFTVDGLVERGFLQRRKNGRYHLHPLLKQFAQEKQRYLLARSAKAALKQAYCRTYLQFLNDMAAEMTGALPHIAAQQLLPDLQNGLQAWHLAVQAAEYDRLPSATVALGEFYLLAGRYEEGIEVVEMALGCLKGNSFVERQLQSWLHYYWARCLLRLSQFEAGMAAAKTAVQLGGEATLETGYAYFALARLLHEQDELTTAVSHYQKARTIAQANDNLQLEALVNLRLANAYATLGKLELASKTQQLAGDHFRQQKNRYLEAYSFLGQANLAYQYGNHLQEHRLIHQALSTFQAIGEPHGEGHAQMNLGFWHSERGNYQAARDCASVAAALFQQANQTHLVNWALAELGEVAHCVADYDEALTTFSRVLHISAEIGDSERQADALDGISGVYAAFGYYEEAVARQTEAWQQRQENGSLLDVAWSLIKLSQFESHRADFAAARRLSQQAKELFVQVKSPNELGRVLHEQGWAAFGLGDQQQALVYFREAWALHERFDQPHLVAEDVAGLLMVQLAQSQLDDQALAKVLEYLDENPELVGTERPFWVYLTCYHALTHLDDPRANSLLQQAHTLLQGRAQKINDHTFRRAYLRKVGWHRELMQLYRDAFVENGVRGNGRFANNQMRFSLS